MLPKLYDEFLMTNGGFGKNFLGTLTGCTKCHVREVRNGAYTVSLETTVNDDCAALLVPQKIIAVKPNPSDNIQYFEVQRVERTADGRIKAEAKHVKNLCFQICSEGDVLPDDAVSYISGTPAEVWSELVSTYIPTNVPFTFSSDITAEKHFSLGLNEAKTLGNILGGKEGSFLDVWGGEYHWDNYTISLLSSRGQQRDYQIRYGSNISDEKQIAGCENTYTHILPYGKVSNGSHMIHIAASPVAIPYSQSVCTKVFLLDCTDLLDSYTVGDHGENYGTVRLAMTNYARDYAERNGLGKLSVNISVTLRAELDEMAQLGLCDTVRVVLDNFGTEAVAKITEATYDVLLERWDKLVIGNVAVTVADMILDRKRYVS